MLMLYEHPFALYCQKVLVALNEQGVAYDVLEEQRDFDRAELAELWPPASIPVLRDGEQIIEYLAILSARYQLRREQVDAILAKALGFGEATRFSTLKDWQIAELRRKLAELIVTRPR